VEVLEKDSLSYSQQEIALNLSLNLSCPLPLSSSTWVGWGGIEIRHEFEWHCFRVCNKVQGLLQ